VDAVDFLFFFKNVRAFSWMNFFNHSVVVHEFGIKRWLCIDTLSCSTQEAKIPGQFEKSDQWFSLIYDFS
jgi:hypothetical protein